MTAYDSNKAAFEKLFTKEDLSGGVEKLLPWRYEVNYYYTDHIRTDNVLSGSKLYYSTETNLLDEAIVRWYLDNENTEGEVFQVALSLNPSWKKNDYTFHA